MKKPERYIQRNLANDLVNYEIIGIIPISHFMIIQAKMKSCWTSFSNFYNI